MLSRERMLALHAERSRQEPTTELWPIQLGMRGDPWRVAVCCVLLNQTTGRQVRPVLADLLASWPRPLDLGTARVDDVLPVIRSLGFGPSRSDTLIRLSFGFLFGDWRDMRELRGVGRYAEDALRLFCLGDLGIDPTDHVLRKFLEVVHEGCDPLAG